MKEWKTYADIRATYIRSVYNLRRQRQFAAAERVITYVRLMDKLNGSLK